MNHSNIYLLREADSPSAPLIKQIKELPTTFPSEIGSIGKGKECDFRDLLWTLQHLFSEALKPLFFYTFFFAFAIRRKKNINRIGIPKAQNSGIKEYLFSQITITLPE